MPRRGFSLIELALVLLILAMVAGAVTLRVQPIFARMDAEGCLDAVADFDRLSRSFAREQNRSLLLVFDFADGSLRRMSEDGRETLGQTLPLASGWHFAEVRLAGTLIRSGSVSLRLSDQGLGPTYAVSIRNRNGQIRRLLVAGLSGQVMEAATQQEVDDAFKALDAWDHTR